ncbi:MAG: ABC transporter permease subunit [Polyangiaceae bacterium]|nr:ABC transporter permease subunit [Polyangiaceae bacterium]
MKPLAIPSRRFQWLRKELRQLLPWAFALAGVQLGGLVYVLLSRPINAVVWANETPIMVRASSAYSGWYWFVWAFVLVWALLPREQDDGTLRFLFSLPVSRLRLFVAKVGAAATILFAATLADEISRWWLHLLNPTSFGGNTFRVQWAVVSLGLTTAVAWMGLGYALLLSVLRWFGIALALLASVALQAAIDQRADLGSLSPGALLSVDFHGTEPLISWRGLMWHSVAACLAGVLGGFLWLGRTERAASHISRALQRPAIKHTLIALIAGSSIAGMIVIGSNLVAEDTSPSETAAHRQFEAPIDVGGEEGLLTTAQYRFRYPKGLETRVLQLTKRADATYERLREALGAAVGPPISVDLTRTSPTHAGSATWDTIRLDLRHAHDDDELLQTLAHETVHVLALRLSDRREVDHDSSTRFFSEGLAEYLGEAIVPSKAHQSDRWFEAVVARKKLNIDFNDLVDRKEFVARFGESLLYPLGYTWVAVLVQSCGADTLGRVLQVLSRSEGLRDLSGAELWQHTLQELHCDLNQVRLEHEAALQRKATEFSKELALLPTLVGAIQKHDKDYVTVRAELEGLPIDGAVYQMSTRSSQAGGSDNFRTHVARHSKDGGFEFVVSRRDLKGDTLDFQLSMRWMRNGALVRHFERWQRAVIGKHPR